MRIAIIGAGICGLYLAWKLRERGEEVTVFEKKEKLGGKACSGLYSEKILYFIPESKNLIQNKIDFCLIHFPKKTIKLKFKKNFFVIERTKLDELVAHLAGKAGVEVIFKKEIKKIPEGFERIIACDGAVSKMRDLISEKKPVFYLGIQGFLKKKNNSNFVQVWPTKNGFIWEIPRGNEIEYGILDSPQKARERLIEFLKEKDLQLNGIKAALIPQGLILPKNERITLCGDAAGLTKPWSGGGVIWGLTAAEILLKNFPDFIKYQKEMKKFFLPQILFSKFIKKLVYFFGFNSPYFLPRNFKIEGDFLNI